MSIPLNVFHDGYIMYEGLRLIVTLSVVGFCVVTLFSADRGAWK